MASKIGVGCALLAVAAAVIIGVGLMAISAEGNRMAEPDFSSDMSPQEMLNVTVNSCTDATEHWRSALGADRETISDAIKLSQRCEVNAGVVLNTFPDRAWMNPHCKDAIVSMKAVARSQIDDGYTIARLKPSSQSVSEGVLAASNRMQVQMSLASYHFSMCKTLGMAG